MNKSQNQFTYMARGGSCGVGTKADAYLLQEGEQYVFMNLETFEEVRMERDDSWVRAQD